MKTDGQCEATVLIGPWQTRTRTASEADRTARGRTGWLPAGISLLRLWMDRLRQRRALAVLPDRLLRDVGLTHEDVAKEIAKPFWRP